MDPPPELLGIPAVFALSDAALPGTAKVPGKARTSSARDQAPHPVPLAPLHLTARPSTLRPALELKSHRPRRTKFNFAGTEVAEGPRGDWRPRRDRADARAYLNSRTAPPTGVAGAGAVRCRCRLRQAGGVRLRASPRSHLPPSRESPRAGPRERQYARAAQPSSAGGGGDAAGGGPNRALGGARGDPAARPLRCPGAAAALAAWGTSLGGAPGAKHRAPLPGELSAKAGAASFCRALRAAVTHLDPESAWGAWSKNQAGGHFLKLIPGSASC